MVKLTEFAEQNRISVRTVQLHIQMNAEELRDHVDRRGRQGTWLDEYAVKFLMGAIQLPSKDEVLHLTDREAHLLAQVAEANKATADAERRANEYAEAAGKVMLLEAVNASQEAQISSLGIELGETREKLRGAEKEAQERYNEAMEAVRELTDEQKKVADLEEALARAERERDEARAQTETLKRRGLFARMFRKGE